MSGPFLVLVLVEMRLVIQPPALYARIKPNPCNSTSATPQIARNSNPFRLPGEEKNETHTRGKPFRAVLKKGRKTKRVL